MAGFVVAEVIALFLSVAAVALAAVACAVRREERRLSLLGVAPGRLARRMRQFNGVGRRGFQPGSRLLRPR
jgi:hypothetical protein